MNNPSRFIKVVLFSFLGMIASCGSFYEPPEIKETTISNTVVYLPMVVSGSSEIDHVETNILENAGFESGTASWNFHSDGAGQLDITSPGYESQKSALIQISSPGDNVQLYQIQLTLEPHTRYRLEFSARSNSGHDVSVSIHKHVAPYTNYGLSSFTVDLTSAWQTFSTEFTTSDFDSTINDARFRFWLSPYDATGDEFFIDNIELVATSAVPLPTPSLTPTPTPTVPPTPVTDGEQHFVAPNGSPDGDGSIANPWDLQTALDHPSVVQPGDVIWVRGGTYGRGGDEVFNCYLAGSEGNPIIVRTYPGERAIINGAIWIHMGGGGWTTFWGLEIMNSDTDRLTTELDGDDIARKTGFVIRAPNTKFINNIVHDTRQGFGFWREAVNSELYGNIIYNNGYSAPDRGHGHGIYAMNTSGTKIISENIGFNQFGGYNIHIYDEREANRGFDLNGNVSFNGVYLVGGLTPTIDISVTDNFTYKGEMLLGHANESNEDLVLENNYIEGSLDVRWWQDLFIRNNFISGTSKVIDFRIPDSWSSYKWDNNTYYAIDSNAFSIDYNNNNWDQWKYKTGFDTNSSFAIDSPSGVDVFVRPNKYEDKRGNIIIYNWDLQDSVEVDVSNLGLEIGDNYTLHNVQNYFEETISGTYNGQLLSIPMNGWTIAKPIGWNETLDPSTFPQFGVFVLTTEP